MTKPAMTRQIPLLNRSLTEREIANILSYATEPDVDVNDWPDAAQEMYYALRWLHRVIEDGEIPE